MGSSGDRVFYCTKQLNTRTGPRLGHVCSARESLRIADRPIRAIDSDDLAEYRCIIPRIALLLDKGPGVPFDFELGCLMYLLYLLGGVTGDTTTNNVTDSL